MMVCVPPSPLECVLTDCYFSVRLGILHFVDILQEDLSENSFLQRRRFSVTYLNLITKRCLN
jgi:hypothetical protein